MIKIAITKGRIEKQVCQLLQSRGYDMDPIIHKDRELLIETNDGLSMIFGKANDVLTFLEHGIVDIGFVGQDTLDESDFHDYYDMLDLNIGKCYFAVAAYPEYKTKSSIVVNALLQNIQKSQKNILILNKKMWKLLNLKVQWN